MELGESQNEVLEVPCAECGSYDGTNVVLKQSDADVADLGKLNIVNDFVEANS